MPTLQCYCGETYKGHFSKSSLNKTCFELKTHRWIALQKHSFFNPWPESELSLLQKDRTRLFFFIIVHSVIIIYGFNSLLPLLQSQSGPRYSSGASVVSSSAPWREPLQRQTALAHWLMMYYKTIIIIITVEPIVHHKCTNLNLLFLVLFIPECSWNSHNMCLFVVCWNFKVVHI